jgi:hypothetical protein
MLVLYVAFDPGEIPKASIVQAMMSAGKIEYFSFYEKVAFTDPGRPYHLSPLCSGTTQALLRRYSGKGTKTSSDKKCLRTLEKKISTFHENLKGHLGPISESPGGLDKHRVQYLKASL